MKDKKIHTFRKINSKYGSLSHCESTCKWRLQVKIASEEVSRYQLGCALMWAQWKEGFNKDQTIWQRQLTPR